ncbi:hypothetical protein [Shewanella denitrificans]|uniref:hypothetical protein n=1 Tax=Shewanella denitrificans TaxID=192073 RepID=UPI00030050CF|nr:hypothetical protein [Shewanella denitrificans]
MRFLLWLKPISGYLVKLDDFLDNSHIFADLIVNPSPNYGAAEYALRAPNAFYCLGPSYTFLRKEFSICCLTPLAARDSVLVTLGGTDSQLLAYPISKAINELQLACKVILLLGNSHKEQAKLNKLVEQYPLFSIVYRPISVADIMINCGLAIAVAGGTLGELASLGVPTLALITVDNQLSALTSPLNNTWYTATDVRHFNAQVSRLDANEALLSEIKTEVEMLWHDKCLRNKMSNFARRLVDSQGCMRVVEQIKIGLKQKLELV